MSHDDFEHAPGLPEKLPEGERMLWQGAPQWRSLALRAFRLREVAIYFAALMVWRFASGLAGGTAPGDALAHALDLVPLLAGASAILAGLAYLSAKSTVYTITTQRIVMRYGMAAPLVLNIPFSRIETAAVGRHGDGTGSLLLSLRKGERIGYLVLWPHARPWRYAKPEPMLRCLPDVDAAAAVLGRALEAHSGEPQPRRDARPVRESEPAMADGALGLARSAS